MPLRALCARAGKARARRGGGARVLVQRGEIFNLPGCLTCIGIKDTEKNYSFGFPKTVSQKNPSPQPKSRMGFLINLECFWNNKASGVLITAKNIGRLLRYFSI